MGPHQAGCDLLTSQKQTQRWKPRGKYSTDAASAGPMKTDFTVQSFIYPVGLGAVIDMAESYSVCV